MDNTNTINNYIMLLTLLLKCKVIYSEEEMIYDFYFKLFTVYNNWTSSFIPHTIKLLWMTVHVHTLWHIATLYICLLLLENQAIFVRCFNDTAWYCQDKHLSGEIMGSNITTDLCDNSLQTLCWKLLVFCGFLRTGCVGINIVKKVKKLW